MPAGRSELVEVASPVGEPELPRGSPVWWWEHYQRHLVEEAYRAPSTIGDYRRVLWDFWASLAPRPPSRATPRDLHRFLGRRTVPGGNSRGLRLAEGTRHVYGGYICSFYRWAAATGRMRRDPMAVVRLPPRRLGPPRALALADVARVLERAPVTHESW